MSLLDRIRGRKAGDDALQADELQLRGGSWHGLLFDNPSVGLAPALTWTFEFDFGEVERDVGITDVMLAVDWVPLPDASWTMMAGHGGTWKRFGEPVECSAVFFEHFRYDAVELSVRDQDGSRLRVAAAAHNDLDGLGLPVFGAEDWLDFRGISVQLTGVDTVDEARRRLSELTDPTGLTPVSEPQGVRFIPAADRRPGASS